MNSGLYIAVFHLRRRLRLRVGALGRFWFRPGVYLYVGSAQRDLRARIERHGRQPSRREHITPQARSGPKAGSRV